MKLEGFLSTKAKCIKEFDPRFFNSWDVGETYDISITIQVADKNNDDICFEPQDFLDHFEPVTDLSKSAPEIDTTQISVDEPKFKVGDKFYYGMGGVIHTASEVFKNRLKDKNGTTFDIKYCCLVSQENYERLKATFPDIEFEQPPKPLTGSHLARLLCVRGKRRIYGYASNDKDMDLTGIEALCRGYNSDGFLLAGLPVPCKYFVPADIDTGNPLTESILND